MVHDASNAPTIPVIRDNADLEACMVAHATGRSGPVLDGLRMTRTDWVELAGAGAHEAWGQAEQLGLPLVDMLRIVRSPQLDELFPEVAAHRLHATPLAIAHDYLAIAIDAGTDDDMLSMLGFVASQPIVPLVATTHARLGLPDARNDDEGRKIASDLGLQPGEREQQRASSDRELAARSPMIQTMRSTMEAAVHLRASDVHIRPGGKNYDVLFRIDGNMVHQRFIIPEVAALVINRVKVFGEMDIAEHRRPQDGRGSFNIEGGRPVDVRVSVVPTVLGESIVIRLLDTEESLKNIDQIQLSPADRAELDDQMNRSHGFFLTTGPTGCGKSTTLYAVLQELRQRPINILTVEDPVEYTLTGVRQMEVNQAIDVTFATALRSFLRHDPDVIMVGEIRDRETARMAVESALTGHLVLSTLHTNTAATTVTRLLELGVEAYLLRAALTGIMAQRLVRLTCQNCRTPEAPAPFVRAALGVGADEQFTIGRGCAHCHGTGVFRRRAVYELMRVSPAIRALVEPGANADHIHEVALAEGMVPITRAGVELARQGHISLAEAYRVRAD